MPVDHTYVRLALTAEEFEKLMELVGSDMTGDNALEHRLRAKLISAQAKHAARMATARLVIPGTSRKR